MDKRKRYFLVLDVETANTVDDPIVYDVGFIIGDKKGNIYEEYSFAVTETFDNYQDLLQTAYYAEKIPQYFVEIEQGIRTMANFYTVRQTILNTMKKYGIKEIYAYNCHFDRRALTTTHRYFTKSKYRWFFPYGTKFSCIWNMACSTLLQQKTFGIRARAKKWFSPSGMRISTSAETVYKYITGEDNFEEQHKGINDVLIEYDILLRCLNQHKKMTKEIDRLCWRKVK
jgi:hypothetical protein